MSAVRRMPNEISEIELHETAAPAIDDLGARRDGIADRRAVLERRLDDGYQRIDAALSDGQDVARWEDFWVGLLREYEALVGRSDRAA
ncbi:MAG TPA: hypothetical protein VFX03_02145 [Thermomicrobiales bacterium]|nr:hypothetical protein [Thermomicrobiales bacterium]